MATQSKNNVYRVRSRVVLNPTDLTIAYPYGGTPLGFTAVQYVIWHQVLEEVRAEEWGQKIEWLEQELQPELTFELLQIDDPDAMAVLFRSVSGGNVDSGDYGARGNLPSAGKLLLAPLNPAAKGFLIRRVVLHLDEEAKTSFSGTEDASLVIIAETSPPSSGKAHYHSTLAGMTL